MVAWKEVVRYDESSPSCLVWACDIPYKGTWGTSVSYKRRAGDVAGSESGGRWKLKYKQQAYIVSRIIWELLNGDMPESMVIDHEDGNPLNNRIGNLRLVSRPVNNRNTKKPSSNKTGVTGVALHTVNDAKYGTFTYYSAMWQEEGKLKTRRFSIAKLGEDEAFRLACEHRGIMINALNEQGAGYTKRHGSA